MSAGEGIRRGLERHASSWVDLRRQLHRHPEVGWEELWTTNRIVDALEEFGLEPRFGRVMHSETPRLGVPSSADLEAAVETARAAGVSEERLASMAGGYTGASAEIIGASAGPTRLFRFDIDALPIQELETNEHRPFSEGFASRTPGRMHACGHDVHTAIGLGFAQMVAELRPALKGRVRVLFQPAEEGVRGAHSMVGCDLLDEVDEFYGLHVGVKLQHSGSLVCGWRGLLATTKWDIDITGRNAHAGINPEDGADALLTAAQIALSLASLPGRLPPGTRAHAGILHAGEARNAVAARARMKIEARALDEETLSMVEERVTMVFEAAARQFGTEVSAEMVGRASAADSDLQLAERVQRAASAMPGWSSVERQRAGYSASDDAATWMNRVQAQGGQATFIGLGTPVGTGHHSPTFEIDESVIAQGVELLVRTVLEGSET